MSEKEPINQPDASIAKVPQPEALTGLDMARALNASVRNKDWKTAGILGLSLGLSFLEDQTPLILPREQQIYDASARVSEDSSLPHATPDSQSTLSPAMQDRLRQYEQLLHLVDRNQERQTTTTVPALEYTNPQGNKEQYIITQPVIDRWKTMAGNIKTALDENPESALAAQEIEEEILIKKLKDQAEKAALLEKELVEEDPKRKAAEVAHITLLWERSNENL